MRFEGSRGGFSVRDTNYGIIMAIGGGVWIAIIREIWVLGLLFRGNLTFLIILGGNFRF